MMTIAKLVEYISEELDMACSYAECALMNKDSDKPLAETYHELAEEEMTHYQKLHKQVVRIISDYKKEYGDAPVEMTAIWNHEHKKMIQRATKIRVMLNQYEAS